MGAGTQARTLFAGFGVSGSLLAAAGAAFVVAGGVMAFDHWPHAQLRSSAPEQNLNVAAASPTAASRSTAQARRIALPPVATAARPSSLGPSRVAARPTSPSRGGPQVVPVGTIPAVQATQVAPAGTGTPTQPVSGPATVPSANPVANTVTGVTGTAARTVR